LFCNMGSSVKKIGVIGLGIIGGSLVKAVKRKGLCETVVAYDQNENTMELALKEGTIHKAAQGIDETFKGCEMVFICVPVKSIPEIVKQLDKIVESDCILTDVGSTKGNVMETVKKLKLSCPFIGGHPMAGSEESGYRASRHTLFENAYYVLTPLEGTDEVYINKLSEFLKLLGALPVIIDPHVHDYATAAISHVPHVIASALVNTIKGLDGSDRLMHTLAAGGFRDITRIASSEPAVWESICLTNKDNIIRVLGEFAKNINSFVEALNSNDDRKLRQLFKDAKEYRDSFSDRRVGALIKTYDITVDVEDKPGVIASIASELGKHRINIKNIGINNSREMEGGALAISFYDRESQEKSYEILKQMGYSVYYR
jgi:prephenate dehydrogenase